MLLIAAAVACAGEGSPNRGADAPSQWVVDSVPIIDIAGTAPNGDLNFAHAARATRLSDGTIVIADRFNARVRFFDPAGSAIRTVGREGTGPGEFRIPSWLGQCGPDSVFVWDGAQHRVTVIDAAGGVVRQYRLPAEATRVLNTVACSRTGTFALLGFPLDIRPPRDNGDSPHYRAPLWLADADGRITHELGEVPVGESRPLGKVTSIAVGPLGLFVGTNDSAFVDLYTLGGAYSQAIPIGVPLRAPTRRHYERAIDRQVAMLSRSAEREEFKTRFLRIPMPEHIPPYGALLIDPDGILWVQISAPGDPETRLRAIGDEGEMVADVRMPADLRVFEMGRDYILGVYEEESGEPHVALWRMRRPER